MFTNAESGDFKGVAERQKAIIESARAATQGPAKSFFGDSRFRLAADCDNRTWYVLKRAVISTNVMEKLPFEIHLGSLPQNPAPFLKPG